MLPQLSPWLKLQARLLLGEVTQLPTVPPRLLRLLLPLNLPTQLRSQSKLPQPRSFLGLKLPSALYRYNKIHDLTLIWSFRPQDKPTAPPAPAPVSAPTPIAAPAPAAPVAQPTAATQASPAPEPVQSEPQPELAAQGWEEPTTVQAPTWDDEPTQQTQTRTVEAAAQEELKEKEEEPASAPPTAPTAQPEIVERVLSALPPQVQPSTAKLDSVQAPAPGKPATPAQHTRPTSAALRHKFKADQAVIMPSGSFTAIEKVGMQFGSLSLGGDDLDGNTYVLYRPNLSCV